jgi:hypothetical protein
MKYLSNSINTQSAKAGDELENIEYRRPAEFENPLMRAPNPLVFKTQSAHEYQLKLAKRIKKTLLA